MRPFRKMHPLLIAFVSVGIAFPWHPMSAAEPVPTVDRQAPAARPAINDVALQSGGVLRGLVLDAHGVPCPQCELIVSHEGHATATIVTNDHGAFRTSVSRGGIYQLTSSKGSAWFRVWQPNTAPPRAAAQALVVQGSETFRGQWDPTQALFAHPHFVLGVAALLIAVPVLIHNNRSDRDRGPAS